MFNPFVNVDKVNAVIRVRRGIEADRTQSIYENGELIYSTDKKRLFVGDSNDSGVTGTLGGTVVGNKIWVTNNFLNLSGILQYDLVYRTDTEPNADTGFYILTGSNYLRPDNYVFVKTSLNTTLNSTAYVLSAATSSSLGGVIIKDGLIVDDGYVRVNVDDSTIKIDPLTKKLYAVPTVTNIGNNTNIPIASENTFGVVKIPLDGGIKISDGNISVNIDNKTVKLSSTPTGSILYVEPSQLKIPIATPNILGSIKVGNGLSSTNTGFLNVNVATDVNFGGLILGDGLVLNNTTGKVDVSAVDITSTNNTDDSGVTIPEEESTTTTTIDPNTNVVTTTTIVNITNPANNITDIINTTTNTNVTINDILNTTVKTVPENGIIKRVANMINSLSSYAAITKDNRVVAWGKLYRKIFGGDSDPTILAVENVRVPFWNKYDGYNDANNYKPYGGDFLDEQLVENNTKYEIIDLYWSNKTAMALVRKQGESGGDVWVAGTNNTGSSLDAGDPTGLVKTKYNNFLISNQIASQGITIFNKDKDGCILTNFNLSGGNTVRDIIEDKTNSSDLSSQSFYYITDKTAIRRINYNGDLVSSISLAPPNTLLSATGLEMVINDNNKNYLYVCDSTSDQYKIKIINLTDNNTVTTIGNGTAGTTDGESLSAKFQNLKRIAVDPSNNNVLYVTDNHRIRRLWRTIESGVHKWKVNTLSLSTGTATSQDGNLVLSGNGINMASFNDPYGIKVSNDGKRIYIAERGANKIRKLNVYENTVNSFSAISETYIYPIVKSQASFSKPLGITRDNDNNLYIADNGNNVIRKINYNISTSKYEDVITFAGVGGRGGYKDGASNVAIFNNITDVLYVSALSALYVCDTSNHRIRKVAIPSGVVTTVVGNGKSTAVAITSSIGINAYFGLPERLTYGFKDNNHYLWVTSNNGCISEIKITIQNNQEIYTVKRIAGDGKGYDILEGTKYWSTYSRYSGDNGPAIKAKLSKSIGGIVYYNDALYFCDTNTQRIRKIKLSDNTIKVVAGIGGSLGNDNGSGYVSRFTNPNGILVKDNELYVGSWGKMRKIQQFENDNTNIVTCSNFTDNNFDVKNDFILDKDNNFIIVNKKHNILKLNSTYPNQIFLINGTSKEGFVNTTVSDINWDVTGLYLETDNFNVDKLYFTDTLTDSIGEIINQNVIFYNKTVAGDLGIGVGTNKPTCGFIKVNAYDDVNFITPKFKRIQMLGGYSDPSSILFAALDTEDSLWVWGKSSVGLFGTGQKNTIAPTKLHLFDKNILDFSITSVEEGLFSIITKDNKMYTCGTASYAKLGQGVGHTTTPVLKICKKDNNGIIEDVTDAKQLVSSSMIGTRNNLYISKTGDVYSCGDFSQGILGKDSIVANQPNFIKVDVLSDIKQIIIGGYWSFPTAFALKGDGSVYGWGYNGQTSGQCLCNDKITQNITTPKLCYNYDAKTDVNNAIYLYCNDNPAKDKAQFGYLDVKNNLYLGGFSTESDAPDFASTIPYFRKYNMKNIAFDVNITGSDALIHRTNGTVYLINRYGPRRLF